MEGFRNSPRDDQAKFVLPIYQANILRPHPLWHASSALTGTRFAAPPTRGEAMAANCTWNLFARENDASKSRRLSGTLSVSCPAWTSWCVRLPCPASTEVMVTAGILQVSAAGKTECIAAGQRIALLTAQKIFIYSIGEQDAGVTFFNFPSGNVCLQKIPEA